MPSVERPTEVVMLASGPIEYRLERRAGPVILLLHGGHVRAGLALGEEVFAGAGYTVLVPSRPGYGRTGLASGPSPIAYADAVRALCGRLGIDRVAAVVGVSGGGPTAVAMAAAHPELVERLVLVSAVGPLRWPGRLVRLGSQLAFAPGVEAATWAGIRMAVGRAGDGGLRLLLGSLSTLPGRQVVDGLTAQQRDTLRVLVGSMRSGRGFRNDLRESADVCAAVGQPTLVIASRNDRGVPFAHAETLAARIPHARLVESRAASHLVWFAADWPAISEQIRRFLATPARPAVRVGPPQPVPRDPAPAFHRALRAATAGLAGAGVLLAAGTAGPAFPRLGAGSGLTFVAVAVAGAVLGAALLRARRWAVRTAAAGLVGQPVIALAAAWQLAAGMPASKAGQLRSLGVRPELGVTVELAYGTCGTVLLVWLMVRWRRRVTRRLQPPAAAATGLTRGDQS